LARSGADDLHHGLCGISSFAVNRSQNVFGDIESGDVRFYVKDIRNARVTFLDLEFLGSQ